MGLIVEINDALNVVIPVKVDADGNTLVYGYHIPISKEVFDANYRILSATNAAIFARGSKFAAQVGPRIATLRLRDEAAQDAADREDFDTDGNPRADGAAALLADIKRLTTVMVPGPNGWECIPVDAAIGRKNIDAEDWSEAESALVFFTCTYAMTPRANRRRLVEGLFSVMPGLITSLLPTEFASSLSISTKAATTETRAASSVPS